MKMEEEKITTREEQQGEVLRLQQEIKKRNSDLVTKLKMKPLEYHINKMIISLFTLEIERLKNEFER